MILQGSKTQKYKTLHNPEKVNLSLQLCSYSCPKDCYHLQDIWKGLWFLTRWLTTLKTSAHCWKGLKLKIRVHCSRKPAWGIRDSETCPGLFLCSPSQNPSWWITCSPRPNASCASFVLLLKKAFMLENPSHPAFFPFSFFFSFSKQGFWRHLTFSWRGFVFAAYFVAKDIVN